MDYPYPALSKTYFKRESIPVGCLLLTCWLGEKEVGAVQWGVGVVQGRMGAVWGVGAVHNGKWHHNTIPFLVDRQTDVKTLPCPKPQKHEIHFLQLIWCQRIIGWAEIILFLLSDWVVLFWLILKCRVYFLPLSKLFTRLICLVTMLITRTVWIIWSEQLFHISNLCFTLWLLQHKIDLSWTNIL